MLNLLLLIQAVILCVFGVAVWVLFHSLIRLESKHNACEHRLRELEEDHLAVARKVGTMQDQFRRSLVQTARLIDVVAKVAANQTHQDCPCVESARLYEEATKDSGKGLFPDKTYFSPVATGVNEYIRPDNGFTNPGSITT
jgi:hypothetical protein